MVPSKPGSTQPAFWMNRPMRPIELRPSTNAVMLAGSRMRSRVTASRNDSGGITISSVSLIRVQVEVAQLRVQRNPVDGIFVHLQEVAAEREIDGCRLHLPRIERLHHHLAGRDQLLQGLSGNDHGSGG